MYGSMAKKTLKGDEIAEILNRETAKWVQTLQFLCFAKNFQIILIFVTFSLPYQEVESIMRLLCTETELEMYCFFSYIFI